MYIYDETGDIVPGKKVTIDCQKAIEDGEEVRVEQSHKDEVNINNIVRKHAGNLELITKVGQLQKFVFDDVTGNDFQESMNAIIKARDTFNNVPSEIRKRFGNDPAAFMDFVHNADNNNQLIEWGLMNPPEPAPEPVQVAVVNQETPPDSGTGA
jgi:phage internal scaffolding protein